MPTDAMALDLAGRLLLAISVQRAIQGNEDLESISKAFWESDIAEFLSAARAEGAAEERERWRVACRSLMANFEDSNGLPFVDAIEAAALAPPEEEA